MMGKPLFVVPLTATVTAGSEASGHPASHLMRFKSPGLTWKANGAAWIRGQVGALNPIDFVSVMAANADSGTTWRVRLGTSQAEVDGTAPYDSGALPFISPSYTSLDGLYHSFLSLNAATTASWWRIDFGGTPAAIEAGAVVIGAKVQASRYQNYDWEFGVEDAGENRITRNGVLDEQPGIKLRTIDFTLDWMTEAEWESKFAPMVYSVGETEALYCCFDPAATAYRQNRTYFGQFRKAPYARGRRKIQTYGGEFKLRSWY